MYKNCVLLWREANLNSSLVPRAISATTPTSLSLHRSIQPIPSQSRDSKILSLIYAMNQSASAHIAATDLEILWLRHKDILHRLYITENKTLKEVKNVMETRHGFPVLRLHDYEVALRELLKLRKNLRREEWYAIGVHISDRKRQAKESEVLWHNILFGAGKVRKEVLRSRNLDQFRHRVKKTKLPAGLVIRTPPTSPGREMSTVAPSGLPPNPEPAIRESSDGGRRTNLMNYPVWDTQIASEFREAAQHSVSTFQDLRRNIPFNRFMSQMLDGSKSQPLLVLASAEDALTPSPRLFGCNPSWEFLARVSFELSNKLWINWNADTSGGFLDWLGMSADPTILRTFFSAKTPTVWAMYEGLCRTVSYIQKPAPTRVLFEIQDIVIGSNPMAANTFDFLKTAVHIGSNADGMLDMARRSSERFEPPSDRTAVAGFHSLQVLFLAAAARRDMAMMRLLDSAITQFDDRTYLADETTIRLLFSVMRHLYGWNPQDPEEGKIISDYIQLLVHGGILTTSPPARCCYDNRPKVAVCYPATLTIDELVMMCPPKKRPTLYAAVTRWSNRHRSFVSEAGIFTAALKGAPSLKEYIHSCNQSDSFEIRATLQESLLFAACLNDIDTVSALLQIGVDPRVELLSKNQERYDKGDLSWNPMLVAAAAGNLEIMDLLSVNIALDGFLREAPIYELVQVECALDKFRHITGSELSRLENLRRHYLHRQDHNADRDITKAMEHLHSPQSCYKPCALSLNMMATNGSFFTVEKRRLETLSWIRNVATAHNMRQRIDEEIIEAALYDKGEARSLQSRRTTYHPCDVLLLEGLVDANSGYRQGDMDLLQLSIRAQCGLEVVKFLLSKGFQVHSRASTPSANTMLVDAILSNSCDRSKIVELLLQKHAEYKQCGPGLTVLEACLQRRCFKMESGPFPEDVEMFKRFFEAGAPVRDQPRPELEQWTPFICLLLQLGAADDLILGIVDAGADLNARGWDDCVGGGNNTPLQEAVSRGRETLAKELIRRGADVHAPADPVFGSTALQAACKLRGSSQFVEYLITVQGASVNEAPSHIGGSTALQWAALRGSLSLAELLLASGADVNAFSGRFGAVGSQKRFDRRRALDVAAMMGRLDMTEFLLKAGGRSSTSGLGGAMSVAKKNRHFAVLSILLDWDEEHGSRIVEEEAEWQRQHPDAARLLSDT